MSDERVYIVKLTVLRFLRGATANDSKETSNLEIINETPVIPVLLGFFKQVVETMDLNQKSTKDLLVSNTHYLLLSLKYCTSMLTFRLTTTPKSA
jgi:hypothetical protein